MGTITIDYARRANIPSLAGMKVAFSDPKGKIRIGTIRIKEIRCGHEGCTKCPHRSYAYAQYRVGKKVTEKYIGVAR